jgi:RHS repeat-associated protein
MRCPMRVCLLRAIVWSLAAVASVSWGAVSAAAQSEVVHYYHTDGIGSVRAVTDQTGEVISRHDYQPFGEEYLPPAGSDERVRFAGKELDPETGSGGWMALNYFGARYLHSATGRFTAVDPVFTIPENIVDPQRWNRYAYVRSNPFRYVDPDGRAIETPWDAVNVGMGVASLTANLISGNFLGALADVGGLAWDGTATVVPGMPGGAATLLRSRRLLQAGRDVGKTVKHHVFNKFRGSSPGSQKYRDFFEKHGIDVDDFAVEVSELDHKKLHAAGNNWTTKWKKWIDENPDASTKEVYQYGGTLMDEYGLSGRPLIEY